MLPWKGRGRHLHGILVLPRLLIHEELPQDDAKAVDIALLIVALQIETLFMTLVLAQASSICMRHQNPRRLRPYHSMSTLNIMSMCYVPESCSCHGWVPEDA